MTETKYHCPVPGCDIEVPESMCMCNPHWFMVPAHLREAIVSEGARGRQFTAYFIAVRSAVEAVIKVEAAKKAKEGESSG